MPRTVPLPPSRWCSMGGNEALASRTSASAATQGFLRAGASASAEAPEFERGSEGGLVGCCCCCRRRRRSGIAQYRDTVPVNREYSAHMPRSGTA
eukprot:ctg_1835.g528